MNDTRSRVEIDLGRYAHNIGQLKSLLPDRTAIMQIVKADAYGHGAFELAQKAKTLGIDFLGVANAEEGSLLRYRGIDLPILILSPSLPCEIDTIMEFDLIPSVSDFEFALALSEASMSRVSPIHVDLDTGMGRSGIHRTRAVETLIRIAGLPNLRIEGIFSHLAASENDILYTRFQLESFRTLLAEIRKALGLMPKYIHLANSSAVVTSPDTLLFPEFPDSVTMVRLGLLSYGVYTDPALVSAIDLQPLMTFKTGIGQIKQADKGDSIGYNRTYIAARSMRYAILPVGYADGYDFLLSNRGQVEIRGELCPVIGKISMDMTAVDLTPVPDAILGDEVTVLGGNNVETRVENIVAKYGGSSYELLCQLGRRAPRVYFENGLITATAPLARRDFYSKDFSDDKLNRIIEAAISQRLHSQEIAGMIYGNLLKQFFADRDRDIHYRDDFRHNLVFSESADHPDYWLTETTLTFRKKLQNDYFIVACANNSDLLARYFSRRDVEYRWLLDENFDLSSDLFSVTEVRINDVELHHESRIRSGCIEIRCSAPQLTALVGQDVAFSVSTKTWYPRKSHQLSVFITEITRGVEVGFYFPPVLQEVEVIPVFAGRTRFPEISQQPGIRTVKTRSDEWVFPNSGIVFAY